MAQPAQDLTAASGLSQLSGRPVVEVADATLAAGKSLLAEWQQLEPIVKQLIRRVRDHCEHEKIQGAEALKALAQCASVVQKLGAAGTSVLRASEGMSKLALLLDAGRIRRAHPKDQSQKQLAATFLELGAQIVKKTGRCPLCQPVEASAKVTDESLP
jgi:predicted RecB family endonuclease